MAARDQEEQEGKLEASRKTGRQGVRFQMIDRDQGLAGGEREPLRGNQTDHDAADQARSGSRRYGVHVGKGEARFVKRLDDHTVQQLDMGAGGDFRDHAPVGPMGRGLAEHHVGQDRARSGRDAAHDRGRGLVAAGFDAEHCQGFCGSTHGFDLC
jgi:hypothetical protein